jgi:outer membrane biosynthesis protein TonB
VSEKVKIDRTAALALMVSQGWQTADTWDNAKIADRLKQMKDVHDPNDPSKKPTDEKVAATLVDVLAACEEGKEFEVTGEDTAAAKKAEDDAAKQAEKDAAKAQKEKEKAAKKEQREKDKADKKAQKAAERAAKKAEKAAAKAAEKVTARSEGTRGYFAGQVFKEFGFDPAKPATDEMIAEVDKRYGKANPQVSKGALAWAHAALSGYLHNGSATEPAKEEAAAPTA